MGFLKKIFKPVSKVLDKVIPNEVKPFLPYAAAFAPMMLGPGSFMGSGIMQRALMSGGMNIGAQLAQEGNEGDINLLSAGLGALSGAMTAPGGTSADFSAAGPMEGPALTKTPGFQDYMQRGIDKYGAESAIGEIAKAGIKSADFMQAPGLMKYGIPAATATGDLMFAQAKRDQDEYDRMMEEESEADAASDAQRAFAIRRSMEAYGATEEEIEDAIYAAGYKTGGRVGFKSGDYVGSSDNETMEDEYDSYIKEIEIDGDTPMSFSSFKKMLSEDYANGGRVGLRFGGIGDAVENIEDAEMKEAAKFAMQDMDIPIMDLVEEFEIQFKRKPNSMEELKQFYKDRYEYKGPGDVKMQEEIKEKVVMEAKDGGLMNLGGKEMDMRGGGFIPIGKKERADDVPARLSKNEFVMTADAVRAAGGGSVNKGAKRMYDVMNKLEARV